MAGQFCIHTEQILTKFVDLAYVNRRRLYRIWLVSPWIGYEEKGYDPLIRLVEAIRDQTRVSVILITTEPKQDWHSRAVRYLHSATSLMCFDCKDLHAKVFLLECNGFRAAYFGSPNFTPRANSINHELAIEFLTSIQSPEDAYGKMMNELFTYVDNLRERSSCITISN